MTEAKKVAAPKKRPAVKKVAKTEEKASLKTMKADLEEEKKEITAKTKGVQMKIIEKIRDVKDRVNTEVVDRSKKVEKIHKSVVTWPLNKMSKVNRLEQIAEDLDAITVKAIKHSYDLVRMTVKKIDDINDEILTRVEKRIAA